MQSEHDSSGWVSSADAWADFVERDVNRVALLDPVMLRLCGDVRGKRTLDVGCGEGRFARMLAAQGAFVTGIDPTVPLIDLAEERGGGPEYAAMPAESLDFADNSFDLVVSYVVLVDINDYRRALQESTRVLAPGGRMVVSNLNGFVTSVVSPWHKDEDGNRLHVAVDQYHDARPDRVAWAGMEIVNWHRPLSDYMQAFLECGLRLDHFEEPRPTPEAMATHPKVAYNDRVPWFHAMVWSKR
ncbi:MAG: class I SAM-dependent methyltransferase [Chthonomonas sp.]|nr:class I SAM-dependent methyltransferase [Chthonomonas sp.]